MSFWLVKSEPTTYSFDDLLRDKKTHWDGVRNFQARNFLKGMKKGDKALCYHSGDDKAVMGMVEIIKEAYPDSSATEGEWVMVDLKPIQKFSSPVSLKDIKAHKDLTKMLLIKQSRLSVMPVTKEEFETITRMGV